MADEKSTPPPAAKTEPPKPAGPPPPPPLKNPGFVTLTIDGKEAVVKPGMNVIEAAKSVGVEIPFYCYHKRLSIAANCRMCLVELSNAPMGKLMPACQMPVAEGITVKTDTPRVHDQQRATLEFLLLNHPVDCAICDQAGECKLQDYYQKYDHEPSRLDLPKVRKDKRVRLGPWVVLDQERCILCTRCVRFMREVAKNPQLGVAMRSNRSCIETFPGQPLDDKYSVNTVDVCPVGALTYEDFRFRGRVWFMSAARSVCTGCSRGCNTFLDYLDFTTYRYRPRECDAVNAEWMCDDGRLSYKYLNTDRVLEPREGRGAAGAVVARSAALEKAAAELKRHAAAGTLAAIFSPVASLEDLLAAAVVAKELGLDEVYAGGRPDGWQDDFLKRADENPNRKGLELVTKAYGLELKPFDDLAPAILSGAVKGLWAVGAEIPVKAPSGLPWAARPAGEWLAEPARRVFERLETFVCQAYSANPVAAAATVLLPASPHAETDGTFVNADGRAQRFELAYFPLGASAPHWQLAAELGQALGLSYRWKSAREVFADQGGARLAGQLGDFKWDSLPWVKRRRSIVPLAAGTCDGRVAGYRERMPREISEDIRRVLPVIQGPGEERVLPGKVEGGK